MTTSNILTSHQAETVRCKVSGVAGAGRWGQVGAARHVDINKTIKLDNLARHHLDTQEGGLARGDNKNCLLGL